ncbi:hypothetical protein BKN38_00325 [Helicobacter sp. CLO-3]|uniref:HobA family DNA replication regulator n=1 Tax=unclassified Helicobacter TaxID=2593540 RepID=UPI000805586A|nr:MULTISPECIES: HobA family DNA replication regulator [unclassified Helicobacter]OBV30018.1 hypothetical protein BA723_03070 [Helicobacter sp. CLO-3]OHU85881.1 hypothetical protein BKN38_00325 [Helicobacter sp. CLO-3]
MSKIETTDFRVWLLESIRNECKKWANDLEWLEMERSLWADTALRAIRHIANGGALLLATDEQRTWFRHYALSRFYYSGVRRPLLPIFPLNNMFPSDFNLQESNAIDIKNMLDIAYDKNYMFWYVGQTNNRIADLCLSKDHGLFWLMDEGIKGAFYLRGNDEFLDYKLIEMLKLFEKAAYACIIDQVVPE